jgi:uncharacterized membrane protein YGL010W
MVQGWWPPHTVAMKTLTDQLAQYAAYHRDRRNIATHLVGIPLIFVAVTVLLARPVLSVAGLDLSPAWVAALLAGGYYLRLDVRLGLLMAAVLLGALWVAQLLAAQPTPVWLGWGLGLFVVGWVIQFVGHVFEGRKPAFVDDVMGLVIGPLFVTAEVVFALGLRRALLADIEARVGPTRVGRAVAAG